MYHAGTISHLEFASTLRMLGIDISEDELHELIAYADTSNSGTIDLHEFSQLCKTVMKETLPES